MELNVDHMKYLKKIYALLNKPHHKYVWQTINEVSFPERPKQGLA